MPTQNELPPLKIGLTGNIGSGKSTVAGIFTDLGMPVLNADKIGHELLESDPGVREDVIRAFGRDILLDGSISRKKLAAIVFGKPAKKKTLEKILHPVIMRTIAERTGAFAGHIYVVIEAALIYEAGLADFFDYVILVKTTEKKAIERAAERLGITRRDASLRLQTQLPQAAKEKLADFVITNNDGIDELKPKVQLLHSVLSSLKGE